MTDQLSGLSYHFVFNHIFKKLANTFEKYRYVFPEIHDVERVITSRNGGDAFQTTIEVIEMLKMHAETSELVREVFENVQQDFWYGISPEYVEKHTGRYYIDSKCSEGS